MKLIKKILTLLLAVFISFSFATVSFAEKNSTSEKVQFTLGIVADNQITLNSVTKVDKGLNSIEAIQQVVVMSLKETEWGSMIISLGSVEASGNTYWALWVNGKMSMVGARDVIIDSDTSVSLILTAY